MGGDGRGKGGCEGDEQDVPWGGEERGGRWSDIGLGENDPAERQGEGEWCRRCGGELVEGRGDWERWGEVEEVDVCERHDGRRGVVLVLSISNRKASLSL